MAPYTEQTRWHCIRATAIALPVTAKKSTLRFKKINAQKQNKSGHPETKFLSPVNNRKTERRKEKNTYMSQSEGLLEQYN